MKQIRITTQEQLDKLSRVEKDEEVIIESSSVLKSDMQIQVLGVLRIYSKVAFKYSVVARGNSSVEARENSSVVARENSSVEAWGNSSVEARGNSSVVARENSSVEAWENSSVVAWENSSVVARENSSVEARENSSVEARENSSVEAWENSSVVAWENSSVVAWENSSVVARENSSVEARENSSVVARENSSVKLTINWSLDVKVKLFGYSVCWKPFGEKIKIEKKSKTAHIQEYKQGKYLDREGIEVVKDKVILFKRVSKGFLTQEGTKNETIWKIGETLTHPAWSPKENECGSGKFHACSHPYFCDEFRDKTEDVYVAIEIKIKDLYEWPNGEHPHKIAFREGKVLYQVDKFGKKI